MDLDLKNFSEKAKYDYRMVLNAIDGDQSAYTELLKRYKDAIFFMLLKMVNNKNDAEDLTIEAFGKAFKNIQQYTPKYAFSTWLFKIATNNCIDFLRRKKEEHVSIDNQSPTDKKQDTFIALQSKEPNPEAELIKDQKKELIKKVVDRLKPRYRLLIELRYFKEFSYDEISDELDLPIGTVKAQLFRARELLHSLLKEESKNQKF